MTFDKAHRVRHHLSKLFKAEFPIFIMVAFHYCLVDYLLELLILAHRGVSHVGMKCGRAHCTLRLLPTIILSTRNSSPLEM